MRYPLYISLILFSFLGFFVNVNAQFLGTSDGDILIEFVPEIPKANEQVSVFIKSYSINVDSSTFTWKINGKTQKTGVGEKNFVFTMGELGQRINLDLSIKQTNGGVINKSFSFFPTSIDLVWQSSGYTPPFYKGKALFSHQNRISIIAIPHIPNSNGIEINPKNMIYKWKKNGSVIESASGFGKNVYTLEGSIISRELDISVEVIPSDESALGYASIKIKPREPLVLFYKKDPLYGIEFQKALVGEEKFGNSNEISLIAVPFFFDRNRGDEYLFYKWSINGMNLSDTYNTRNQVFRQKEGTEGTSKISLTIENTEKLLQYANGNINLTFNNKPN